MPEPGFQLTSMHAWAMATAAVVSAGCAIVGSLLVVRRMSLVGDAISHAVLPGIAVAVLAGGRPGGPLVMAGAVATALLTVALTRVVRSAAGIAEDASAGVVFTTLFALGVVIVTAAAARIDLDPGCVLYGILELVPFDTLSVAGVEMPRAFVTAALVCGGLAAALAATWKEQVFTAFDADAARAAGVPVAVVTGGLLAAAALATVASFEAVGAILVVAMLVVPAATAELVVHRLHLVVVLAVAIAVTAAVAGYVAAWRWSTSAAGMIAVVLGAGYAAVLVLGPGGLAARAVARAALAWRVRCEDCLTALWRAEESPDASRGGAACGDRVAIASLAVTGQVVSRGGRWTLSPRGRSAAETVVRSHRLWEAWLGRHAELPLDHLHPPAEWIEHHIGADVRRRLETEVGTEGSDPHGRAIPPER